MAKQRKQVNNEEPIELTEDDRNEMIEMLVGNCNCQEDERELLNNFSDETLARFALNAMPPQLQKGKKKVVAEEEESDEEMMDEEEMPVKNQAGKCKGKPPVKKAITVNKEKPAKVELDERTQFLVNYAERKMQEEKDELIEKLTANLAEEDVEEMVETLNEEPIEKLERMVKLLPKEKKQEVVQNNRSERGRSNIRQVKDEQQGGRSYVGAGGALPKSVARQVNNSRKQTEEDPLAGPMESPTLNYGEIAGYKNGTFVHRNQYATLNQDS
jgi:hypothetical protein